MINEGFLLKQDAENDDFEIRFSDSSLVPMRKIIPDETYEGLVGFYTFEEINEIIDSLTTKEMKSRLNCNH